MSSMRPGVAIDFIFFRNQAFPCSSIVSGDEAERYLSLINLTVGKREKLTHNRDYVMSNWVVPNGLR